MQLYTPVAVTPSPVRISHQTPLMLLGSCFSDNIGLKLQQSGFDVLSNPFGTLYNPLSIALVLTRALDDNEIDPSYLVHHDGVWHSWLHHSRFSNPDPDICLQLCNQAIHAAHNQLIRKPVLIITFGTAYTFFLTDGPHAGQPVANCHKLPPQNFSRTLLSLKQILDTWHPLLQRLTTLGILTIFTVSPIRHIADGLHQNQISKSTLHLAIQSLLNPDPNDSPTNNNAHYYPSYEILLDQLRDYRFYARDMCHPSDLAVDIIWQHFQETHMTPATIQQNILNTKKAKQSLHTPIISNP